MRGERGRRRRRDQRGLTLVEVLVVSFLLPIVMGIGFDFLYSMAKTTATSEVRSESVDNAHVGIEQIDRQVRSGNVLYDPAQEVTDTVHGVTPGLSLRIYTQANSIERCVQWRITARWSTDNPTNSNAT